MLHTQDQNHIDEEDGKGMDDEVQRCLPLKKRHPTCARCRNHGLILNIKGHKRTCEYRECRCSRCNLVSQRRVVMAKQVALSREQVRQHRQDRDTSEQLPESQRFYQDAPTHPPPVIDLTSERPDTAEEIPYPVVQPSPDSTNVNIGYCNSPYIPWELSRENISQPTQMTSSPQRVLGQASQYYPTSFHSSQIDETHRSRMAFTANHSGRPMIPSPVVHYQSNDPLVTYLPDRISGATPIVNIPSSQGNVGVASHYYPTSFHPSQIDGTCRSNFSFPANHMVRPVIPCPLVSNESIDALPGFLPYRLAAPSANFSSPHSVFGVASQHYPTPFPSSQVDETYRCQVSVTANHTFRPVLPSPMIPHHSFDAMSAHRDNYTSAYSQCNSTATTSFHTGDRLQSTCYCNVKDQTHRHPQLASHVSSSNVAPFEERAASISSFLPSIMTAQTYFGNPDQHPLPSVTSTPYAFQTTDESPMYSQNVTAYKENDPTFRSQIATTSQQAQGMPSAHSDYSSFRRPVSTTSRQPQDVSTVHSDEPSYRSRRPYPLRITIPSLQLNQSSCTDIQPPINPSPTFSTSATTLQPPHDVSTVHSNEHSYRSRRPYPLRITIPSLQLNQGSCTDFQSPIDPSPTFSPSTLSLLTNATLPTSDIPSPGFFASSLPTFNYPSPTLPTQSSPVFSYPSPYTNPSLHAGAPSFQDLVDSHFPITSHSTSNYAEQIRIPPKYDDDIDGDREGSEIDVCSLDQYSCQ